LNYRIFISILIISTINNLFAAQNNYGLDDMKNLQELPYLRSDYILMQESSHDPSGGNKDWNNFLYNISDEHVLADMQGPGIVNRIWLTGYELHQTIRFYFDGEETPSIEQSLSDFFAGINGSFLSPLIVNDNVSSGGLISFMPFPFRESLRITTTIGNADPAYYYNVTWQKLNPDVEIETWTGSENTEDVRDIWNNMGEDPKQVQNTDSSDIVVQIAAGDSVVLYENSGSSTVINELFLKINELKPLEVPKEEIVTDNGKAFTGYSRFSMNINSENKGAVLERRSDYGVGNQIAKVYVDSVLAGYWSNGGSDMDKRWRNHKFYIPANLVMGKDKIDLKIEFVQSNNDWNEFYYTLYAVTDSGLVETDKLDVGNSTDEYQHKYSVSGETWSGDATYTYHQANVLTDNGKAFVGYSQFTVKIDSLNNGVKLTRRLDYGISNQKANIYVDGDYVGQWFTEGSGGNDRWLDSSFDIPSSFTENKSEITVKVSFVSAAIDWNEFFYWIYSKVDGDDLLSDFIDVGNSLCESQHQYTINQQNWSGFGTFTYKLAESKYQQSNSELLSNIYLKINWDNEEKASVEAPIGMFFSLGTIDAFSMNSLMSGFTADTSFYSYWPMVYKSSATISLINKSSVDLNNVNFSIKSENFIGNLSNVGKFKTEYKKYFPTVHGNEIKILETEGAGKFVGFVLNVDAGLNSFYLEGDERYYIDDAQTPFLYGTGTEDYFNGAWYFINGPFSLQQHGQAVTSGNSRSMYRHHLSDPISFLKNGTFYIEHGAQNDVVENYQTLAFYYLKENHYGSPESVLEKNDELNIGDSNSEYVHKYAVNQPTWSGDIASYYEGTFDNIGINSSGKHHHSYSSFTMNINSDNYGVRLLRTFDYSLLNQKATVYVDDVEVGQWYSAGSNSEKKIRDEFFLIPESFTKGKSKININITADPQSGDWSENYYATYSILDKLHSGEKTSIEKEKVSKEFKLFDAYPNPFNPATKIEYELRRSGFVELTIFDVTGKKVETLVNKKQSSGKYSVNFNASALSSGVYFYKLVANSEIIDTKKMILLK